LILCTPHLDILHLLKGFDCFGLLHIQRLRNTMENALVNKGINLIWGTQDAWIHDLSNVHVYIFTNLEHLIE
jgi:hypothetical protein